MTAEELVNNFPFEYVSGGYYRQKDAPKGQPTEMIHGQAALKKLAEFVLSQLDSIKKNG